jgi:hypothetical protein
MVSINGLGPTLEAIYIYMLLLQKSQVHTILSTSYSTNLNVRAPAGTKLPLIQRNREEHHHLALNKVDYDQVRSTIISDVEMKFNSLPQLTSHDIAAMMTTFESIQTSI